MRYFYLLLFLSFVGFCSFSCERTEDDDNKDGQTSITNQSVAGYWYASEKNYIYSLYLDGEGNSLMKVYECETDKTWKEYEYKALYTLSQAGDFVYQFTEGEHLSEMKKSMYSGKSVLTGNNLSLQFDQEVMMFSKYSGAKSDLATAMKEIEENMIIITPEEEIAEENFWKDDSDFLAVLNGAYIEASIFVQKQIEIERVLMWSQYKLNPYSSNIEVLWNKGYLAINYLNRIIAHADGNNAKYKDRAIALRAFIYYNMAMLWGNIPYIEQLFGESDTEDWNRIPQLQAKDIYAKILTDLQGLNITDNQTTMMSQDACEILKKEIYMALGQNYDEHISSTDYEIFKVRYDGVEFSSDFMNVYTQMYLGLLNEESKIPADQLVTKWDYSFQLTPYGAWAMLKRIGKATEYGRKDYELLLPIPNNEIKRNPYLRQNPGYDSDYYL